MSLLQQQIKDQVKQAMLARDSLRLDTLRGLLAAFTNELVAQKRKPQEEISDEDALKVISRAVKQRKDSIEQFNKGNRKDLVQAEEAELKILHAFLPKMMGEEEIEAIVAKKKVELGITDKSKIGLLMSAVMKELKGKADGADVKQAVEKVLQ